MRGKIYTEQKCTECGGKLRQSDRYRACVCEIHPHIRATGRFLVVFGRDVRKRFTEYQKAERFLDGLRYEVDKGSFDARDYSSSDPLSFISLTDQYD